MVMLFCEGCDKCASVDFIFTNTRGCLTLSEKLDFREEHRFNSVDNLMLGGRGALLRPLL